MFGEHQAYVNFARVDRLTNIKSHIAILAITQKLDPQSVRFWLIIKVHLYILVIPIYGSGGLNTTPAKSVKYVVITIVY